VRDGDIWKEVSWQDALERVSAKLAEIRARQGAAAIAGLASPHQTMEELYLFTKLLRGLGTENIDHRPAQSVDTQGAGARWLGMPVADLNTLDRVLLVGSTLRQEQPLVAQRLRQAVKRGAQMNVVHSSDDDLLCKVAGKLIVAPSALANALARIAAALRDAGVQVSGVPADFQADDAARAIAESLRSGERKAVLLGAVAQNHPAAREIHVLAQAIAAATGATLGFLSPAANSVGGQLAGALPGSDGLAAAAMFAQPRAAYVLLGVEPDVEAYDPAQALAALKGAELVVQMAAFKGAAMDYADVLLPIAPFTETGGAYVNMEGRLQSFHGAVKPQGEARPAWKVLRVLGNLLNLNGFDYDSVEAVLADVLPQGQEGIAAHLDNDAAATALNLDPVPGLERLGDTPINQLDALTRRARPLLASASAPKAWMRGEQLAGLNLNPGDTTRIRLDGHEIVLPVDRDDRLAAGTVRIAAAHAMTAGLGARFGTLSVEKA
jgi:NADH-quinone oxidoreductase subunit G